MRLNVAAHAGELRDHVGMSSERLQRVGRVAQDYIDSGQITGAVSIVARRGKTAYFEANGLMDVESKTPMRKDACRRFCVTSPRRARRS